MNETMLDDSTVSSSTTTASRSSRSRKRKSSSKPRTPKYSKTAVTSHTTLSYDPETLTWDQKHHTNTQQVYCYCGQSKDGVMLCCDLCGNWFHQKCLTVVSDPLQEGDWGYHLKCAVCGEGTEHFGFILKSWEWIVHIAVYNTLKQSKQDFVRWKEQIGVWLDRHWDTVAVGKTRTPTWISTVAAQLSTKVKFINGSHIKGEAGWWSIDDTSNPCDFMDGPKGKKFMWKAGGVNPGISGKTSGKKGRVRKHRQADEKDDQKSQRRAEAERRRQNELAMQEMESDDEGETRKYRRKKKTADEEALDEAEEALLRAPGGKAAFKAAKSAAEEAKNIQNAVVPSRVEANDTPQEYWLPIFYAPSGDLSLMKMLKSNSAPQVKIDETGLKVSSQKGYRLARASHPVLRGRYYFEVKFEESSPVDAHVRVGFATEKADPQTPVGFDGFGYSIRDIDSSVYNYASRRTYGQQPLPRGSVIGCLIELGGNLLANEQAPVDDDDDPPATPSSSTLDESDATRLERVRRARELRLRGEGLARVPSYYDATRTPPSPGAFTSKPPDPTPGEPIAGSAIWFFVNGKPLGAPLTPEMSAKLAENAAFLGNDHERAPHGEQDLTALMPASETDAPLHAPAFTDIASGQYYAAVSCYMGAQTTVNFGPNFDFPPPAASRRVWPMHALATTLAAQHRAHLESQKRRNEQRQRQEAQRLEKAAREKAAMLKRQAREAAQSQYEMELAAYQQANDKTTKEEPTTSIEPSVTNDAVVTEMKVEPMAEDTQTSVVSEVVAATSDNVDLKSNLIGVPLPTSTSLSTTNNNSSMAMPVDEPMSQSAPTNPIE